MILSSVSVLGLTIDYGKCPCFWYIREPLTGTLGPYAFMDIFDRMHVCNHTDEEGRYAYKVGISKTPLPPIVLTPWLPQFQPEMMWVLLLLPSSSALTLMRRTAYSL
jgi:hypothetical protein